MALVLSRKHGEKIHIGDGIVITVLSVVDGRVKIGVECDKAIPILRGELRDEKKEKPANG